MMTWLLRDNRIDRSIWNIILKRIHNLRYANDVSLKSKQLGMILLQRKMIQFIIEHLSSNEIQHNFMAVMSKAAHDDRWRLDFMVIGRIQKEIWPNKPNKQFNFCEDPSENQKVGNNFIGKEDDTIPSRTNSTILRKTSQLYDCYVESSLRSHIVNYSTEDVAGSPWRRTGDGYMTINELIP